MNANNMSYHVIEERAGAYHLVRSYANLAGLSRAMKVDAPRWVIFSQRATLESISTLGMVQGYYWNGYDFEARRMPQLPLVIRK